VSLGVSDAPLLAALAPIAARAHAAREGAGRDEDEMMGRVGV